MNKEVLKKVIELSVNEVFFLNSFEDWNAIDEEYKIFRADYVLSHAQLTTANETRLRQLRMSEDRPYLTISYRKHFSVCGHTTLANAVKSVINYQLFADYLVNVLSNGALNQAEQEEFREKVITPICLELGQELGEVAQIALTCLDFVGFCCLLGFEDSNEYIGERISYIASSEGAMTYEQARTLVEEGKAEEIVDALKKSTTGMNVDDWEDTLEVGESVRVKNPSGKMITIWKVAFHGTTHTLYSIGKGQWEDVMLMSADLYDMNWVKVC